MGVPVADFDDTIYEEITFRPHQLGFYLWLAVILGLGLAALILSVQLHPAWLLGAALMTYVGAAGVSRYSAGSLGLRGYDLVLYQGRFVSRELTCPLWQARLEIHQTILGRALDTGTVVASLGEERYRFRVSQLKALRRHIAERKVALLMLAERRMPTPQSRVVAGELEDRWW